MRIQGNIWRTLFIPPRLVSSSFINLANIIKHINKANSQIAFDKISNVRFEKHNACFRAHKIIAFQDRCRLAAGFVQWRSIRIEARKPEYLERISHILQSIFKRVEMVAF